MASSIDATKPVSGTPTTASVRANFSAAKSEIEALQANTVSAGAGLTGGGAINANPTVNVGAGTGITVNADDVALDTTNARNADHSAISAIAGNGLTGGGTIDVSVTFNVGAGTGITVAADSVAFDTTWGDARYAAASHTHAAGDVTSGTFADARIPSLAASKITSGTFADARISQSSVTQHQSAINAGQVDGKSISVVASLPGTPDANTIYFVTG